jgi:glyoxylase-like metal-dependent hydrolase (beta-lactamase superfamily II)
LEVTELAPGLWRWTARHPEWTDGSTWSPEVGCFYVEADDATLLVDPLVPDDEADRFWTALDRDVERRGLPVAVLLTETAHVRSAGEVAARYGGGVWGHEQVRSRVGPAEFHPVGPSEALPGGARVLGGGYEEASTPMFLPSYGALAPGDAIIEVDGELRVWWDFGDEGAEREYRERLLPALQRWLELPIERVLVAHGEQRAFGRDDVAAALERPPWPGA